MGCKEYKNFIYYLIFLNELSKMSFLGHPVEFFHVNLPGLLGGVGMEIAANVAAMAASIALLFGPGLAAKLMTNFTTFT